MNENYEYSEVCAICIVCGKSTPHQYSVLNNLICKDCKRAILYAKEKMMEKQDAVD